MILLSQLRFALEPSSPAVGKVNYIIRLKYYHKTNFALGENGKNRNIEIIQQFSRTKRKSSKDVQFVRPIAG